MNVFLSWSGDESKLLAQSFRNWLPLVIQSAKPFFSQIDIEKGARWLETIASELERCQVGILFVTNDNVKSPWLIFEAGAMSTKKKICTIFFDLKASDVKGPLMQFQGANFQKDDVFQILKTINECLDEDSIEPKVLENSFKKWWPDLQKKVKTILDKALPYSSDMNSPSGCNLPVVKSWQDIMDAVGCLYDYIKHSSINFDYIVSFSDGGLIAADLLHVLYKPEVPVISCVVRRCEALCQGSSRKVEVIYPNISFFEEKSILLLDDVVDTGNTIKAVAEFLRDAPHVREIYTVVLGKAEHTPFKPHYFAFQFSGQCILPYGKVPRELPMSKK